MARSVMREVSEPWHVRYFAGDHIPPAVVAYEQTLKPATTFEEIEMMIVTCKGQPTRLLAPPLCPVIDGPTVANIQAKGIPTVEWERDDYDALLSHVVDALGR